MSSFLCLAGWSLLLRVPGTRTVATRAFPSVTVTSGTEPLVPPAGRCRAAGAALRSPSRAPARPGVAGRHVSESPESELTLYSTHTRHGAFCPEAALGGVSSYERRLRTQETRRSPVGLVCGCSMRMDHEGQEAPPESF